MKPLAVIYFQQQDKKGIFDLVARMRNSGDRGVDVRPVWGNNFRGPGDMNKRAQFIVVQQELPNADTIMQCYASLAGNIEIHICDKNGDFVNVEQAKAGRRSDSESIAESTPTEPDSVQARSEQAASEQSLINEHPDADAATDDGEETGEPVGTDAPSTKEQ